MISETELEKLSHSGAPHMKTAEVPGPLGRAGLEKSQQYESMARGGGAFPLVFDQGLGVTVKDPDGNLLGILQPERDAE